MTDADRLLRTYIERFESGGPADPTDLLDQLEGPDRARLEAMIDGYLEHGAPPRKWDPEACEGSVAERAVAHLSEQWSDASGHLPVALVDLRKRARIKRAELVARLAEALGVSAKREKVGHYYHQLEFGLLPSEGVSSRVFEALAPLLGTSPEELRRAGESGPAQAALDQPAPSFARTGRPDPTYADDADEAGGPSEAGHAPSPADDAAEPDEVDRLFTGGG